MILKGSQRGGGRDLAVHLMRVDENEHVTLHELRGFASDTLQEAFQEADAISRGTRCRQYLFSLSLNPPEDARVPVEIFENTIDAIEQRLGLTGQPRAIVFHEKEGRRHAHCVWSRIDAGTMTARALPFFKNKLMAVSRDLYLEHGWKMPGGMIDALARDPANFTLAEWQQAKRAGSDPRWTKAVVQECWAASDGRKAFESALQSRGFWLAKGDRRGFVMLDHDGAVHALARMLDVKTRDVRARLGDGDDLNNVADTKRMIGARMTPAIRRHVAEARDRFKERAARLGAYRQEMTRLHRQERGEQEKRQQAHAEDEARARAARLPRGLKALWQRITGQYRKLRAVLEAEAQGSRARQAAERQALIDRQQDQRRVLQERFKALRRDQAERLLELRQDVGRYLRFSQGRDAAPARSREPSIGLKLGR